MSGKYAGRMVGGGKSQVAYGKGVIENKMGRVVEEDQGEEELEGRRRRRRRIMRGEGKRRREGGRGRRRERENEDFQ